MVCLNWTKTSSNFSLSWLILKLKENNNVVLKDPQSNILGFFFLFPTIDCNGLFSLTAISISIIISMVIMIPKSLSYRAGCQLVS